MLMDPIVRMVKSKRRTAANIRLNIGVIYFSGTCSGGLFRQER